MAEERNGSEHQNMADALDRWSDEGGAPATSWVSRFDASGLPVEARRVLEVLGAALVSEWADLPRDIQKRVFDQAASGRVHDAAVLKARIARFLHDNKDRE